MLSSTSLIKQTKKCNYVWNNSCWKWPGIWQNSSSTTKAIKKDTHRVWQDGRKNDQVGTHTPCGGTQKRRRISWALGSSLGREGFESHIRHPSPWNLTPGRKALLACLKPSGVYKRAIRNKEFSPEECSHSLAYSWSQCGGSRLKTAGGSGWLARPPQLAWQPVPDSCSSSYFCSSLKWRLLLPRRICTVRHYWVLILPLTRTEAAISSRHVSTHIWAKWNYFQETYSHCLW